MPTHNTNLHLYPHKQEEWERITFRSPAQPQLFKLSGNEMISWKENINGEQTKETTTKTAT